MLWVIRCVDKPGSAPLREAALQAHRDYVKTQKAILVLSGATEDDEGTAMTGSCLVINVASREEAERFCNDDPFSKAGVFASVTITRMRKSTWNPDSA